MMGDNRIGTTQTPTQSPLDAKAAAAAVQAFNTFGHNMSDAPPIEAAIRAYLASQEAAEPSEEPVAWQHRTKGRYEGAHWGAWLEGRANFTKLDYEERPLFASPAVAPVAINDIAAERHRQIKAEGWTPEHDDTHARGEMAMAAAAYAVSDKTRSDPRSCVYLNLLWPWGLTWWKPKDRRHDLVRAGALIVAEIERLDRAEVR